MKTNPFQQGLKTYLNDEQLACLQAVRVGIGGVGGLGSNIALLLVRCGFTRLEIIDHDMVEPSNLNRQQFTPDDIGRPKVLALKNHLLKINPDLAITTHQVKWSLARAGQFFKECSVIVEAFDGTRDKKDFVEFYQDKAKLIVCGSGLAGSDMSQTMGITELQNIVIVGDKKSETSSVCPPLAPRVTQCAAMMAGVVLEKTLKKFVADGA